MISMMWDHTAHKAGGTGEQTQLLRCTTKGKVEYRETCKNWTWDQIGFIGLSNDLSYLLNHQLPITYIIEGESINITMKDKALNSLNGMWKEVRLHYYFSQSSVLQVPNDCNKSAPK